MCGRNVSSLSSRSWRNCRFCWMRSFLMALYFCKSDTSRRIRAAFFVMFGEKWHSYDQSQEDAMV